MSDRQPKKTDLMSEAERDAYHAEKMRKKKEARTRMLVPGPRELQVDRDGPPDVRRCQIFEAHDRIPEGRGCRPIRKARLPR